MSWGFIRPGINYMLHHRLNDSRATVNTKMSKLLLSDMAYMDAFLMIIFSHLHCYSILTPRQWCTGFTDIWTHFMTLQLHSTKTDIDKTSQSKTFYQATEVSPCQRRNSTKCHLMASWDFKMAFLSTKFAISALSPQSAQLKSFWPNCGSHFLSLTQNAVGDHILQNS